MNDWLTAAMGEAPLPYFVRSFAKPASGSSEDDDDLDEDEEDDDEDEEDDEEDDPDEGKSDEELRAELKKTRDRLAKANGSSAKRRRALRAKEAELAAARKAKPKTAKKDDEDEGPDLDEVRREAAAPAVQRAKLSEAKSELIAAGVPKDRALRAARMLDLDELDLDDEGLDGIEEAIDKLKADMPEFFGSKRRKRPSVAGDGDRGGDKPRAKKPQTASERQAASLTGGGR